MCVCEKILWRASASLLVQGKKVQPHSTQQHTLRESYSPNPVAQNNVLKCQKKYG